MAEYQDDDDSHGSFEEASWLPGGGGDAERIEGEGADSWDDVKLPGVREMQQRAGDNASTVKCGECGKMIFDDTPRCPYCGFMQLAAAREKRPWWFVAMVIFLVLMFSGVTSLVIYFKVHMPGR